MFKVMLVDDENMVRKGIRMSIDWPQYGVEITSEARNGAEALEKLREGPVHLILSDIRMPVMSGIELARSVKKEYPEVEMVLLSGYEDFGYAKEAMSLGIRHYLLKPVLAENLVETVAGLRDEEKGRRLRRQGELLRGQMFRANAHLLRSRLVSGLLEGRIGQRELSEQAALLGMETGGPFYSVFAAELDDYRQLLERLTPAERDAYDYALLNIAEETLAASSCGAACLGIVQPGRLAGIVNRPEEGFPLDVYERLTDNVRGCLGVSATVGAGRAAASLTDTGRSYAEAIAALRQKAFLGKGGVIAYQSSCTDVRKPAGASGLFREEEKRLAEAAAVQRAELFAAASGKLLQQLEASGPELESARGSCIRILHTLIRTLDESGMQAERALPTPFLPHLAAAACESLQDIMRWMRDCLASMEGLMETGGQPCAAKRLVKEAIRYAGENSEKAIGLAEAAGHIGVTPSHLSKIFKEETGTTFIKWLTRHRMEEAERLLRHSRLRTADIAGKVGYQDYKYFSLMFKKHTGMSPRDYRNR